MANTIETILELKNQMNNLGYSSYDWFFNDLENNHISKMNGTQRNASILREYDDEAQAYIIQQLFYINASAAIELMKELKISEPFVSTENHHHIVKP